MIKEFMIWGIQNKWIHILLVIVFIFSLGYIIWNYLSLQEIRNIEYIELEFSDCKIKTIDVSNLKIKKANGFYLIKEIQHGFVILSDGTKKAIVFYPQSNSFSFVDSRQRYNIQYHGLLAYQMN